MINIAIVEDDPNYVRQLTSYIETYAKEHSEKINVTAFSDGDEFAMLKFLPQELQVRAQKIRVQKAA